MCGIVGVIDQEVQQFQIQQMLACLQHRGPDDQGVWEGPDGLMMGQRRLSIIDLSVGGHQPMVTEGERSVITFNGEIYNFPELRLSLEQLGHHFRSSSDTEVILRGYEQWGEDVVQHLVGMFAFAIWDSNRRELFLARDRAGEKPLYYAQSGMRFAFASELPALALLPWVDTRISSLALSLYLNYQYVPAPHSIYQGVHKLPPAHAMRVQAGGQTEIWRYWDPYTLVQQPVQSYSQMEALEQLEVLLKQSVRSQLLSDVPLGAFLSGGVDSSLITALMQEQSTARVKTFTIGFEVPEYNEAEHAQAVAGYLGTEHTTEYLTERDALNLIPALPRMYGEPFADSSALPTHLVSQVARKHVTVALSGDGADEAFGGYIRYDLLQRFGRAASLLGPVKPLLTAARPLLPDLARRLADVAGQSQRDIYRGMVSTFSAQESQALTGIAPVLPSFEQAWNLPGQSGRRHAMLADLTTYLPEAILVKVDRAAMATSLETRAPFLDHRVLEFSLGLSDALIQNKILLKQLLYRRVPRTLVERPKQGFGVPLARWFRQELRDLLHETITVGRLTELGIQSPELVINLLTEHQAGRFNHAPKLWAILVMCLWSQNNRGGAA